MTFLGTLSRLLELCERITFVQRFLTDQYNDDLDVESSKTIRQMVRSQDEQKMGWTSENDGTMKQEK